MTTTRTALRALVAALVLALWAPVSAQIEANEHLLVPSGPPDGYLRGVFEGLGCGQDATHMCAIVFTKADGTYHTLILLPNGPLFVNGAAVVCGNMPPRGHECDDWSQNIVIGRTPIRLPYWWYITRGGKRVAYTDQFMSNVNAQERPP